MLGRAPVVRTGFFGVADVSEEEAFIRAVVDGPWDDTPRLVYADWLDDRADPRGPYLRAELEWAKPWRSGERPPDSPELRMMATGLDRVWVARVSRPPAGVCCDRLEFTDRGPVVSSDDLDEFERVAEVRLPDDFRAFLLNINGAITPVAWVPTPGNDAGIELYCLYGIGPALASATDARGSLEGLHGFGDDARPLLPVGNCGSEDWLIVVDVTSPSRGEVLLFEDYHSNPLDRLAGSFAEFLSLIEPRLHEES
ncbi:MAG TPA: TIGR02996 domain-containing protein [Gemmataceae bacterium]|nr:TIGR02996 domain-containing protein [Gemmataceae bacterium]